MKPFNFSPEQKKKWVLTTVLLGSLGFTLSMNPEHYNNIVRNDINAGVFELALSQDPSDARFNRKSAAQEAREEEAKKKAAAAGKATVSGSPTDPTEAAYSTWSEDGRKEVAARDRARESSDSGPKTRPVTMQELDERMAKIAGDAIDPKLKALKDEVTAKIIAEMQAQEKARAARNEAQLPAGSQAAAAATTANPANGAQKPGGTATETGTGQAAAPTTGAAAPAPAPAPTRDFVLNNNKDLCRATFKKADGKVVASVDKASDAMPCSSKGDYDLKSAFADIEELAKELKGKLTKEDDKTAKADKEKEEKKEKIAQLKEKYEGLVKSNCTKKGMEYTDRLECVQNLASELSDKLDDSSASKALMRSFLGKYVIPRIKEGMVAQTITYDAWGRPVDNYDNQQKVVAANDSAMYLLEHLNSDNSDSWVVQQLAQTRNSGYNAQIGYARDMYLQAQEDKKDPMRFQLGVIKENIAKMNLNPFMLNGTLARDRMDWTNALSSGDKGQFQGALGSALFTPVQSLISRLPKWDTYGKLDANKQDMAALALANLNIDSFGLNNGGLPFTPGTGISGIPTGLTLESRLNAQNSPRTNGLADIMTARGTSPGSVTGARGAAQKLGSPATGTQYRGRTAINQ